MAAYRQVYDSHHLQADCQVPGSAPEPYTLCYRVWATFTFFTTNFTNDFYDCYDYLGRNEVAFGKRVFPSTVMR